MAYEDNNRDIRETGPVGLKGMRGLNSVSPSAANQYFENLGRMSTRELNSVFMPQASEDIGLQLAQAGYGASKYDANITGLTQLENIGDVRAQSQSGWAKIGAGLVKMGILAGTTFVDGVLGTIAGMINFGADVVQGNIHSGTDAAWSFINNPFSKLMADINEEAESWVPNYYSKYEQSQPWYKNIFTANFLGDKVLKNLGFTIGAAAAAMTSAGLGSKALINKGVRDAFKGAVKNAAGNELKTGAEIYKAYRSGDAVMDGLKLTEDLGKAAKQLRNAEWNLKTIGAVTSAAGEGRIEAINGADEWEQNIVGHLEDKHKNFANDLEEKLFKEHPEYFGIDANGNRFISNYEAAKSFQEQVEAENKNYEKARAEISQQKAAVGNRIFGLNLALLSGSNLWQFGRAMAGSYTVGRTGKELVKGSIKEGFKENKALIRNTRLRALSNPLMEAQEEMSQSAISEGSGLRSSSVINNDFGSFYGGKIDPDAEEKTQNWLSSVMQGFANTYSDINRWEEGFIGGLTGILGIPKIKWKTKDNGKKGLSIKLDGELWQGFRDAKEYKKESKEIAEYLNKRVQSPEFINYYQGNIRHDKYGNIMDDALERGDEFEYKNAKHSQIVSDAIMFNKAGRLQDFLDMIDESGTITAEDVKAIREATTNKETQKSVYDNMTDEQVIDKVKKQADTVRKTVEKYAEISTNLKKLYGDNIDENVLEELTWGMTQVNNWEQRLGQLSSEVRDVIKDKAQILKDKYDIDLDVVLNNYDDFAEKLFQPGEGKKSLVDEINDIIADKNLSVEEGRAKIIETIKAKKQEEKANNLALGQEILRIKRKAKAAMKSVEKQREKALFQMAKASEEKENIEQLREEELNSYNSLTSQAKATLKEALSAFRRQRNGKKMSAKRKKIADRYEQSLEEEIKNIEEGRLSIYDSFQPILDKINTTLDWAEATFNTDVKLDARFKRGYNPLTKSVAIGSESSEGTTMVSESEAEARSATREKNYNILFEILDLQQALEQSNGEIVNPLDVEILGNKLIDMIKILASRTKFIDTYQKLSENPELFDSKLKEKLESTLAYYTEKKVKSGVEALTKSNINSISELRKALSNFDDPTLIPKIFEEIKKGENKALGSIIEEFENIEEARNIIFGTGNGNTGIIGSLVSNVGEKENVIKAGKLIEATLDNSNTIEEAKEMLKRAVLDSKEAAPALSKTLEDILNKYIELSKSSASNKRDKKAKRNVKNNNSNNRTRASEEDNEEEEEEDNEEEATEERREEPNRRSPFDMLDEEPIGDNNADDESAGSVNEVKSSDSETVKTLKEMTVEDLAKIIRSTDRAIKERFNVDGNDITNLRTLAHLIMDQKLNPSVHNGQTKNEQDNETNFEPEHPTESSFRSTLVTKYIINPLKDRLTRRAVRIEHATARALDSLDAFDFVDSGKLGLLLKDNPELPIHYIIAPSKSGVENAVLLGIEVTPEVNRLGAPNAITGSDGKKYQIVGSLGSYSGDTVAHNSRLAILEGIREEAKDSNSTYFVSKKYTNVISHIYSGRIVKSTDNNPVERRSLKEVLNGQRPHFGIYYSESNFKTPTIDRESEEVVLPNSNNTNPREGSVWLMTREADGRYYAKAVQVKRFTNEEWDFNKHMDTPIMQEIVRNIEILANPNKSDTERSVAKFALETLLYFGDYEIFFNGDVVSIKDSRRNNVANNIGEGQNNKVGAILTELSKLNLRFQIQSHRLSISPSYSKDIVDSDILDTDLALLNNVNASFDMPLLDPATGKRLYNVRPEETKGHTGRRGVNNTVSSVQISIGNNKYTLDNNGVVTDKDGNRITGKEAELVIFKDRISKGIEQPVQGNNKLYVGYYNDTEEFGFYNGRLVEGEELESLKDKAERAARRERQLSTLRDTAEKDEDPFEEDRAEEDNEDPFAEDRVIEDADELAELSDDELTSVAASGFFSEESEESPEEGPSSVERSPSTPTIINIGETFNPEYNRREIPKEVSKLLRDNLSSLKEAGFGTPRAFINAAKEKGIYINSITSKEKLEGILTNILCEK